MIYLGETFGIRSQVEGQATMSIIFDQKVSYPKIRQDI